MMKYYTNPQMLSPEALHEAHLEMAKNYLESKWDGYYYEIDPYIDKPCNNDNEFVDEYKGFENCDANENEDSFCPPEATQEEIVNDDVYKQQRRYYVGLTNEQFSEIQKRIKESGENVLSKALSNDPELKQLFLYKYSYSPEEAKYAEKYFDYAYAERIGDIPHVVCNITACTIDPTGSTEVFPHSIMLTKEDYLKLLVIVMDHRRVTFNELYEHDFDLFKKISGIVNDDARDDYERNKKLSYTLVFDEIEKDVQQLLGEEDDEVTLYEDIIGFYKSNYIKVDFSEMKMAVFYKKDVDVIILDPNLAKNWAPSQLLYNIDTKAVMNALHVDSYHEATTIIEERFSGREAFDKIKEFLEKENIAYEFAAL